MKTTLIASLALLTGAASALHEDDPKILHRQHPFNGPVWRQSPATFGGQGGAPGTMGSPAFGSNNVTLKAWFPLNQIDGASSGNDCWGYVSPSGREYGIMCTSSGTAFFEVTNPANTQLVGWIDGNDSLWRDVKVYGEYAYSVTEGSGGIQVISLANIDAGQVTLVNTINDVGTANSHNVVINEDSGFLYRSGGGSEGLRMYSLANPASPQYVGSWSARYVHDAQVVTYTTGPNAGREIAYCCAGLNGGSGDTGLTIVDVTNKANPTVIGQVYWPNRAYSHQGWLSEDRQYFYMGDELDENGSLPSTTYVIDVSDPDNAFYVTSFTNGNLAITHNCYTKDGLLYAANYTSGLRVFDLNANPTNPPEYAFYDTYAANDGATFNGLWSVFPYFPSGTVIGSDLESGFFVWDVGQPELALSITGGAPDLVAPGGDFVEMEIQELVAGSLDTSSPTINYDLGTGMQSVPMVAMGGTTWRGTLPSMPCGSPVTWFLTAQGASGQLYTMPEGAPGSTYGSMYADGENLMADEDMEANPGWTVGWAGDTATTGIWEYGDPVGTAAQPEDDHTESGSNCWFTGQGSPGGSVGANDVDGGATSLVTSSYDLSAQSDPTLSFFLWYSNTAGASPNADVFRVDLSSNGGSTWVNALTVGPAGTGTSGGWIEYSIQVASVVSLTNQVRVRFVAEDAGSGSIVEAAVDDFRISELDCSGASLGTRYCSPAATNSTAQPGVLDASGSAVAADNDLTLTGSSLPTSQFCYFVASQSQASIPNPGGSMGTLCLGAPIARFNAQVQNTGPSGSASIAVDLTSVPLPPAFGYAVQPGETWNWQLWYRDVVLNPTSNFTDAISITFQ